MPSEHAFLSASGSHKWLNCPPSAKLEEQFSNKTSVYAEEGTLAHEMGEITLKLNLSQMTKRTFNSRLRKIQENELYTKDMPDYVEKYVLTCLEKVSAARETTPDAIFKVEDKLDFSRWVPKGFGTGDFVIIADGTLEICDLKYGKGVKVDADHNPQMMLYALGALNAYEFLYDITKVRMTIIQPRIDNLSEFEISVEDLYKWADDTVKPLAEQAMKGEGEFKAGEHCGFCRAKCVCKARANKNLELAKYEFRSTDTLSNGDIADILPQIPELKKWADDVEKYALSKALEGEKFKGFKVVEGRSSRKYTDQEAIISVLRDNNYALGDILKPEELLSVTNLEKAIGKKNFNKLVSPYVDKPPGKPTLAKEDDKRPEYTAIADFLE